MKVGVVGLGKIGLPLAVQFAGRGCNVWGVDIDPRVVDIINAGNEPFPGEFDLERRLREVRASGAFEATCNSAVLADCDAIVVVVPLIVEDDGTPEFGALDAVTKMLAGVITPGTLISYETTIPVGTTRNRFTPVLEAGSGMTAGEDFFVVFSPERVFSGRIFADLRKYPKLIGGLDLASAARGIEFYERVLEFDERPDLARTNGVWDLGTAEAAELAKLAETTYRDVNIGLANQFARFAATAGIDVYQVIEACNSQVFSHIHQPGISVGGHCIPVYPRLYLTGDPDATVVIAARQANADMPAYAAGLLEGLADGLAGKRVAVLGAAYRGGVKETAFSGVFPLVAALRALGADVAVEDPLYSDAELAGFGFAPFHRGDSCDAAIIQTDHTEYASLTSEDLVGVQWILDGRRVLNPAGFPDVQIGTIGQPIV